MTIFKYRGIRQTLRCIKKNPVVHINTLIQFVGTVVCNRILSFWWKCERGARDMRETRAPSGVHLWPPQVARLTRPDPRLIYWPEGMTCQSAGHLENGFILALWMLTSVFFFCADTQHDVPCKALCWVDLVKFPFKIAYLKHLTLLYVICVFYLLFV